MNYSKKILMLLRREVLSLAELCDRLGIRKGRDGHWSSSASERYIRVSADLQRLKCAGKIRLVRGKGRGAGGRWSLARPQRSRRQSLRVSPRAVVG